MVLDLSKYDRHQVRMIRIPFADPGFDLKVNNLLDGLSSGLDIKVIGLLPTTLALLVLYIEIAVANG